MRRRPRVDVDAEPLLQRVADLEALLTSPGWALVCAEANKQYGARTFAESVVGLLHTPSSAQQIGERAIALIAGREAATFLLSLPDQLREDAQRTLAAQVEPPPAPGFGPTVEVSQ